MADTHVTIVGNLVDDPEVRYTPAGAAVANLRVAVTSRVKDGDGWRDGETSFYRVTCWRALAENAAASLSKGDRVIVLGSLRQRSWETPEGDKRSVVEVRLTSLARACGGRRPSRSAATGRVSRSSRPAVASSTRTQRSSSSASAVAPG
jgi:single-strand DNA-binding protein